MSQGNPSAAPTITELLVVPVAGHDSMLLNLSGAHGPFFSKRGKTCGGQAGRQRSRTRSGRYGMAS